MTLTRKDISNLHFELCAEENLMYNVRREGIRQFWHAYDMQGRFIDSDKYSNDLIERLENE